MTISRRGILATGVAVLISPAQEQKKLKLGFIGTGHRAWAHIQVLKAIADFEVLALADPTSEFLDRAASLVGPGVRTYSNYEEMLDKERELDGVIVVTPTFLHAAPTIAALSSGHHVLCEKPMALTVDEANQMIAASEKAGKVLQIGLQMRYDPLYEKMAQLVKTGEIGPLQYVAGNLWRTPYQASQRCAI